MADITSRPFQPNPEKCCARCVFGTPGPHADLCPKKAEEAKQQQLNNGVPAFRHPEQKFL